MVMLYYDGQWCEEIILEIVVVIIIAENDVENVVRYNFNCAIYMWLYLAIKDMDIPVMWMVTVLAKYTHN